MIEFITLLSIAINIVKDKMKEKADVI